MISWKTVSVAFDGTLVVGPVTLSVDDGEWVGLIGPNGAGKSTLIKSVIGAVPHEGSIEIGQRESRAGLDVAWMPQRPHLPDEMSVANYVLLGRTPHIGYLASETSRDLAAAELALSRLSLAGLADRPLATLSGGEAQRAVLARALAQESPVLLLDEPTSSLDIGHGLEILEMIDDLRRADSLTVVTALHDLTLAGQFADRLVLMDAGRVVAEGAPGEVLTEERLRSSYGRGIKVVSNGNGPIVIPSRKLND